MELEEQMPYFKRVCLGTHKTEGILVPEDKVTSSIKDFNKPAFISLFKYNEKQYKRFKETNSVSGIDDVVGDTLIWDFDSIDNLNLAFKDSSTLVNRLKDSGVEDKNIQIFFSGNKGFTVQIFIDRNLTPSEIRNVCVNKFGEGLDTLDTQIYNASRIIRCPWTKHEKGLHKIPLSLNDFNTLDISQIKEMAKDTSLAPELEDAGIQKFSKNWIVETKQKVKTVEIEEVPNLANKPANLSNCRYFLQNGFFKEGQRSKALLCLGASYKNLGFSKEMVFGMLQGVAEVQARRNNADVFPDDEIQKNIIDQIYGPLWNNGQFTCRNEGNFLYEYCKSLGEHGCKDEEKAECVNLDQMLSVFYEYAENFDKNIIKTGIPTLDDNLTLVTPTLNGLLGNPGAGKTSVALQILRNASMNNINSMFLSMDMGLELVCGKMLQRENGLSQKAIMAAAKKKEPGIRKLEQIIKEDYRNVSFCYSSLDPNEIKKVLETEQARLGQKIKLVVIDYLECIPGPHADSIANTGVIINKLKDIANQLQMCIIVLLQTQKHSTADVSDPLLSLKNIKGSSIIEQTCSTITTLWREGYHPETVRDDKYISFAVVKNRFGPLWKGDFSWDGPRGLISELSDEDRFTLNQFKEIKKQRKLEEQSNNGWS